MSSEHELEKWLRSKEERWESLCGHCGACCGVTEGDPCEHLRGSKKGEYYCNIYENRFGEHKTVNCKTLKCVPIRQIVHGSWPGDECCGYKKDMNSGKGVEW